MVLNAVGGNCGSRQWTMCSKMYASMTCAVAARYSWDTLTTLLNGSTAFPSGCVACWALITVIVATVVRKRANGAQLAAP